MMFNRLHLIKGLEKNRISEQEDLAEKIAKDEELIVRLECERAEELSILKSVCDDLSGAIENGDEIENDYSNRFRPQTPDNPFINGRWLASQGKSIETLRKKVALKKDKIEELSRKSVLEAFLESRTEEDLSDYSIERAGFNGHKWGHIAAAGAES